VLAVDPPVLGRITGSHSGYRRMGVQKYERSISLLDVGRWRVLDELGFMGSARHLVRLHWLILDGEWHMEQHGLETRLRVRVPGGWIRIGITSSGLYDAPPRVTLIRAGKVLRGEGQAQAYEGWMSPTYGHKLPALSLAVEAAASHVFSFITEFSLPGWARHPL
jgi:hypothetical protein